MEIKHKCSNCKHLNGDHCIALNVAVTPHVKEFEQCCGAWRQAEGAEPEYDAVSRPAHYANSSIECIDAMLAARGREATIAFCECNAFKYIWRTGKKDDAVQELKKAAWYINKAIELREGDK